ncbi:MAG: hydroxymethylbilane synthase [Candidatus Eisenbacteria bacterium]|uniref:Porphobilinogen deaminase n=1 Tax=Eiseniibacteriota bacterium TaxID=2212470 RepID=A0A538UBD2_UNCEI|nr:MAG: hydroxymethylbilane synthase [Candidatus Eisenbacteria bacterium]
MATVRIGTRASALARWQTDHVIALWREREPGLAVTIVDLTTQGDDLPEAPLEVMEGTGFFTSTLERALLEGRIDVAVHSMKDLPTAVTPGLAVAAIPTRGPVEDALCARDGLKLARLPAGARVGTSSVRRTAQLRALRADLDYRALRGNVPTRLSRVAAGDLDAVVLARAGLVRLGLAERVTEVFKVEAVLPAPAQGALALQARADDAALIRRLATMDHEGTRQAVAAEREVLRLLRGGCSVPVGALARLDGAQVSVDAGVFAPAGDRRVRVQVTGASPEAAGAEAACQLLARGAREILAALDRTPKVAGGVGP